eukprot:CAMPEP_0172180908 /NCGR_PEP_ID=MMETSP1050-20130122/17517_1 /TAXON_ID=233186 /ORGANISM="Cryptomonas curvata, Strain CCAP979/52" /LENGTH=280 /DNA_ID=CAMNT_0012854119 /DNA_START=42 /DNA_END=881 /DNA_ORIENTATION=+
MPILQASLSFGSADSVHDHSPVSSSMAVESRGQGTARTGFLGTLSKKPDRVVLNPKNPAIKEEILKMIVSYLQDEGYNASSMLLQDEANVRRVEIKKDEQDRRQKGKNVKKAIVDGDWAEVEKFLNKSPIKSMKSFLFYVYKQQYLELIDRQEFQKAFTYLTKKLKPFEGQHSQPEEFKNLCYLLTCKSIADVDKEWDGIGAARARLAAMFASLMADSELTDLSEDLAPQEVPPGRLLELLEQAVEFQIASARHRPRALQSVTTLARDLDLFAMPNALAA